MTTTDVNAQRAARNGALEEWLDGHDIGWRFEPAFPLDDVDVAASVLHQARTEMLDETVVERYAADMARGDVFPAILVLEHGKRSLLAGGNHRVAGARSAGRSTLPAYVLGDVADDVLLELTIEDNRRHGLPLTESERLRVLVRLVNLGGRTQTEAAAICGVSQVRASRALALDRADSRARRLDVEGWTGLTATIRAYCDRVVSDDVFIAAAEFAARRRPGPHAIEDLTRACNAAIDVDAALGLVEAEDAYSASGRRGAPLPSAGRPSARVQMASALSTISMLKAPEVIRQCATHGERAELARQVTAAAKVLQAVMVGIENAGTR